MNEVPLKIIRQTAAEVLAYALYDLFPGVTPVGSTISDIGFSYAFEVTQSFGSEMMPLIEERMRSIVKEDFSIAKMDMMRTNALELFRHHGLSLERLQNANDNLVQIVKIQGFFDLCDEVCGDTTGAAGVFKLLTFEKVDSELRISGTAFANKQELKEFLKKIDKAKGLDFTTLASEMRLYEKGVWYSNGVALRNLLINFFEKRLKGFEPVFTLNLPGLAAAHPFHSKQSVRYSQIAYFPDRTALLFHVFCTEGQLHQELISSLQFFDKIANIFGFRHHYVLCPTRARAGEGVKNWGKSIELLIQALKSVGFSYETDQHKESAFGPRIEMQITDNLGRKWIGPSIGMDLRSGHKLTGSLFESIESLIELLLESYAGVFPLWLAPEQIRVVPLAEANFAYAREIQKQLLDASFRVGVDTGAGGLGEKMHSALQERVPYIAIVGEKEEKTRTISVRLASQKENRSGVSLEDLLEQLRIANGSYEVD